MSELPPVDGIATLRPASINSRGDVVGTAVADPNANGPAIAFFYDASASTMHRLRADGTSSQVATAINGAREIVGWVEIPGPPLTNRAVRWDDGKVSALGALPHLGVPGEVALAQAINERGQIAGWSVPTGGWSHGVLWDPLGLRDLGTGTAPGSAAQAINASCVAAGMTFYEGSPSSHWHAAVFEQGRVRELGTLPGADDSFARAINDSGRVVGTAFSSGIWPQEHRAFVYDLPSGPMRDIAPDRRCDLWAVSSKGIAVGFCSTGTAGDYLAEAVILRGDTLENLDDLVADPHWVLNSARSINDAGQIVGIGLHDGQERGFLLTPR